MANVFKMYCMAYLSNNSWISYDYDILITLPGMPIPGMPIPGMPIPYSY